MGLTLRLGKRISNFKQSFSPQPENRFEISEDDTMPSIKRPDYKGMLSSKGSLLHMLELALGMTAKNMLLSLQNAC